MVSAHSSTTSEIGTESIIPVAEAPLLAPLAQPYTDYRSDYYDTEHSLVFDMGSYHTRVGWSNEQDPRLEFDSIVSKFRERSSKGGPSGKSHILVGSLTNSSISSKSNIKSPFDTHVINTIEYAEYLFDYGFLNLGINTEAIEHSIVLTEPAGNSVTARNSLTELLFEGYGAPKLTYGIDSLFSFYENNNGSLSKPGLVVSAGHHATHFIPIFDQRGRVDLASRISYGGYPAADFMLKSMQLKFPTFPEKMSFSHALNLVQTKTFFSEDYSRTLRRLGPENDIDYFNSIDVTVQFPYKEQTAEEKSNEEIERIAQRRREQSERLKEHVERQRKEKLAQKEIELENLQNLKTSKRFANRAAFQRLLEDYDMDSESELDAALNEAELTVRKLRSKLLGQEFVEEKAAPVFDLIDIHDDELSEDSKREKRKQKLLKAGYDARERARLAKEAEEAAKEELARQDSEFQARDFQGWLEALRSKHEALSEKIRSRKQLKQQLADRRSQASQQRMRSIANLAREEQATVKRTRNRGGEDDDHFGANDNDWMVYRQISKAEGSDDEDDTAQLAQLEAQLLEHDPTFQGELASQGLAFNPSKSFLHRFQFGTKHPSWEAMDHPQIQHQLHVNVERVRVPEVLFQPSILGLDQAGPEEIFSSLFNQLGESLQLDLIQNVLLCGGFSQIPNLDIRLSSLLTSLSPTGSVVNVRLANHPVWDSWRGAARYARNNPLWLKRDTYLESGHDYSLEHGLGNWC